MYTEYRIRLDQERKEYIEIQSRVTATFCCFFFMSSQQMLISFAPLDSFVV